MREVSYEEAATKLEQIREEILDKLYDCENLLRKLGNEEGRAIRERAKSYWFAHITIELGGEHDYLAGSMCSMQDTVNEIRELVQEEAPPKEENEE